MRDGAIVTALFVTLLALLLHGAWHAIQRGLARGAGSQTAVKVGLWTGIFLRVFFYGQSSYLTWSTPHNIDLFLAIGLLLHLTTVDDAAAVRAS